MNTDLALLNASVMSMTSLEISELVGSAHSNVRISIERLAKRDVIQLPPMQEVEDKQSLSPNNKTKVYLFSGPDGKRDSIVVVAQLSPEFTGRLVDRWQELEGAVPAPKPLTAAEHLRLTADILERQDALEARLESQARQLQQIETASDHFTVIGWYRWAKLGGSLPLADAAAMGKQATKFCKDHEIAMGEVPDARFGRVRTYPKWVLEALFCDPPA